VSEIGDLEVLLSEKDLSAKVEELAGRIARDYRDKDLLVVGVLKGAWVFLADLVRFLPFSVEVDFIRVSSYGTGTESSGRVRFEMDLTGPVEGKHVLLVEDIVDTGITLSALRKDFLARGPADVRICALLDKVDRRKVDVPIEYRGFEIPDRFVVGFGLDCAEWYRNLPYIAALTPAQAERLTGAGA